jgi:phage baseplate assembly protein W
MKTVYTQQQNRIAFSDLDLNFNILKSSKNLDINYNDDAIKQSVKNLILTRHYEKPFHSNIGSSIYSLLFEQMTVATASIIEAEINSVLTKYEPRITLSGIIVKPDYDNHIYDIQIEYYIVGQTTPVSITVFLEKLR